MHILNEWKYCRTCSGIFVGNNLLIIVERHFQSKITLTVFLLDAFDMSLLSVWPLLFIERQTDTVDMYVGRVATIFRSSLTNISHIVWPQNLVCEVILCEMKSWKSCKQKTNTSNPSKFCQNGKFYSKVTKYICYSF